MATNNDQHPFNEYSRYLNNQMSNEERYLFERKMECDPFEYEALEGFSGTKAKEIEHDLRGVRITGFKRKFPTRMVLKTLSIAAIIAVFVFLIMLVPKINWHRFSIKMPKLSKNKTEQPTTDEADTDSTYVFADSINNVQTDTSSTQDSVLQQPPMSDALKNKELQEKKNEKTNATQLKTTTVQPTGTEQKEAQETIVKTDETTVENEAPAGIKVDPGNILYKGKVFSSSDKQPVQGVSVRLKGKDVGTTTDASGNFYIQVPEEIYPLFRVQSVGLVPKDVILSKDGSQTIFLEPEANTVSSNEPNKSQGPSSDPQPYGGMALYKNYISKNLVYPKNIESPKKETLRVRFKVSLSGEPYDVEVDKSPGESFTNEATRLVLEGPKWSPAIENGKPSVRETEIKIVFKP